MINNLLKCFVVKKKSKKKLNKKKPIPKAVRTQVWKTHIGNTLDGKCYVCNRIVYYDNFDAAHIIAEANGGLIIVENLRVTCKPCNTSCGTQNLNDFKKMFNKK
jgi:5-methylcytosine-specific restriction endonuclease McrA